MKQSHLTYKQKQALQLLEQGGMPVSEWVKKVNGKTRMALRRKGLLHHYQGIYDVWFVGLAER